MIPKKLSAICNPPSDEEEEERNPTGYVCSSSSSSESENCDADLIARAGRLPDGSLLEGVMKEKPAAADFAKSKAFVIDLISFIINIHTWTN